MTLLAPPIARPRLAGVFATFLGLLAVLATVFGPHDLDCVLQPRACALRELHGVKSFRGAERSDVGGTEAPRVYAVAGLYRDEPVAFERAIPGLMAAHHGVWALISCRPTREPVTRHPVATIRGPACASRWRRS